MDRIRDLFVNLCWRFRNSDTDNNLWRLCWCSFLQCVRQMCHE